MAFDPNERKRRRQELAEKRREADRRKKKLLIRLGIALVVVLICVIVILMLPGQETNTPLPVRPTEPVATPTEQPEEIPESIPEETIPPETVLHLVFGGDLNITDRTVETEDFSRTFLDIAHLFADADISALNLEGLVAGSPYGSSAGSAPYSLVEALSDMGVDGLQLANSCSLNKGLSGLSATAAAVQEAGITPLGVKIGSSQSFAVYEIQGIRIAFVAFTKGMDGLTLPQGSEGTINLLYTDYDKMYQEVDTAGIGGLMEQVNSYHPDLTVAMLHWGSKLNDTISKSQTKIIQKLLENGVDAIVGTHPHYVQKMEYDEPSGQFVAYSLGDLLSDGTEAGTEYSVVLDLEVTRDNTTGRTRITGYDYTPIFTVNEEGQPLRVLRIREAMAAYENGYLEAVSQQTYQAMQYALTRIEDRISGE